MLLAVLPTRAQPPDTGTNLSSRGGDLSARSTTPCSSRYRLTLFAQVLNLANHPKYIGYSGTELSPFFLKPTDVRDMRKIDIGVQLQF